MTPTHAGWKETPHPTAADFELFRRLIRERSRIALGPNKAAMLRARLGKIIRRDGHRSFRAYYRHVLQDDSGHALQELLDAVATNKTEFLREADHFDLLGRWPFLGRGDLRVWCAGCATGEEAYSLVMTVADRVEPPRRVDVLATDLSQKVLAVAREGIYPEEKLCGIPQERLRRFFLKGEGAYRSRFKFKPQLAAWIRFRSHNLLEPLVDEEPFDAVFCRNVLMYFERSFQEELVARFAARLRPGGLLFLGHAESLTGFPPLALESLGASVYRARGR